jgi:hypothetical protein
MRGDWGRLSLPSGRCRLIAAVGFVAVLAGVLTLGFAPPAEALPSFARQTGQPCGTCHTDFPALTPFGRRFKLLGYTTGGGAFRTTPFPAFPTVIPGVSNANDSRTQDERMRDYAKSVDAGTSDGDKEYVPPISMMAITGFTRTQSSLLPPPAASAPFTPNNNTVLSPFSGFWGGAVTDHIGAFAQVTYNAPPPGGFPDPFARVWNWDNTDVRYANTASIGPFDFIYGITANNNPTVQDVWNTTPAWAFPYAVSTIASTPTTKTLIQGAFAAHVGGVGAYTFINDTLYLELSGYRTLTFDQQNALGIDPFAAPGLLERTVPYWRVAFEPHWGPHTLMVGTFGMIADVNPWVDPTFALGTTAVFPQSDKFSDTGFDAQYQYQGSNYWLTLRGSYIREFQKLDATFGVIGGASNPTDLLNALNLQASVAIGGDNRFVFTGQYFNLWGTSDPLLYGGLASGVSPNSIGYIGEIAYIPFGLSQAPGWPWFNMRLGLQYTYYDKFDGTTVGAHGHDTLFIYAWFAM